jgi:ketosteroid isomerase-like protein
MTEQTIDETGIDELVRRWAAAEEGNDAKALDALLADGFTGVGPFGFVLQRDQWLVRFENGLHNHSFAVGDTQLHVHGPAAVVIGVLTQHTNYRGQDTSDRFRVTLALVRPADTWQVASVHIGPLKQPPAPPAR